MLVGFLVVLMVYEAAIPNSGKKAAIQIFTPVTNFSEWSKQMNNLSSPYSVILSPPTFRWIKKLTHCISGLSSFAFECAIISPLHPLYAEKPEFENFAIVAVCLLMCRELGCHDDARKGLIGSLRESAQTTAMASTQSEHTFHMLNTLQKHTFQNAVATFTKTFFSSWPFLSKSPFNPIKTGRQITNNGRCLGVFKNECWDALRPLVSGHV